MHGLGNDFVVIDERTFNYNMSIKSLQKISDRRYGVGCDQILFIGKPSLPGVDFSYYVVNSDGTRAEHCGNGLRCVAYYLSMKYNLGSDLIAEVSGKKLKVKIYSKDKIKVEIGCPSFEPESVGLRLAKSKSLYYPFILEGEKYKFGALSIGNPHAVFLVKNLDETKIEKLAQNVQKSDLFSNGVNVGFMEVINDKNVNLRVWERGVGYTEACGTGACAAIAFSRALGLVEDSVTVQQKGGKLLIEWKSEKGSNIFMTGSATHVFDGSIQL